MPGPEPRVAALILAAGRSRRLGETNKLLADVRGRPLITWVADHVCASRAEPVWVVTGHEPDGVRQALAGADRLRFVHNPSPQQGLSSSLRVGLAALPTTVDGALVCLGDMPHVDSIHLNLLIGAFARARQVPAAGSERPVRDICVPIAAGRRGNPVLWPARCFDAMAAITGDVGARSLLEAQADRVQRVDVPGDGVLFDIDTPDDLANA